MDCSMDVAKTKQKVDVKYLIKSIIGIAIMIFFRFIPAPDPITPEGMAVLGIFIGCVYLWSAVDMMWPTFVAIVIFGFTAYGVYPNSWQLAGIYEAGSGAFGNYIVIYYISCLLIVYALSEAGTFKRICMWFLTRESAKKSAWKFTFMLFLSTFIIGLFLDISAVQLLMFAIAHELFEILGFKKGDRWPKYVMVGITFTAVLTFSATPICHTLPILFMGIYSAITGASANMLVYMAAGIPVTVVIWIAMLLWFKKVIKITENVPQLSNIDWNKINQMKPAPMEKREKITITLTLLLIVCWILPAILGLVAPETGIYKVMHTMTDSSFLLIVVAILAILSIGGKPLLNLGDAFKNLPWLPIVLLAGIMLVGSAIGEPTTGITAFLANVITPLVDNMSPFMIVAVLSIGCILLTNVANHVPVGIVFVSVGVPLFMALGYNPLIIAVAIAISADLGYATPSCFVPIAFAYADPYCDGKAVLKNGLFMTVVSCIACALLIYPIVLLFS